MEGIILDEEEDYSQWMPGDKIIWAEDKQKTHPDVMTITRVDYDYERVYWYENGNEEMTRCMNMLRVREMETQGV